MSAYDAPDSYGKLLAELHITGYTFEQACRDLKFLLQDDRWKLGGRFDNVNQFLDSIRLDKFRAIAEQRKEIANRIKELQPEASNRQIATTLGVSHTQINDDLRGNNLPRQPAAPSNTAAAEPSTGRNLPPALTGAQAAQLVDRRDRGLANAAERETTRALPVTIPEGKYPCIILDPPWPMEKIERDVRPNQVGFEYPTMTEQELSDLDVGAVWAADNCHLFCWTTQKFLPLGIRLLDGWGFKYVCQFVWHKPGGFQPVGLPQYNCEFVLYGRRGAPRFVDTKDFPTCFEAPRRQHSRKPDLFYDTVRRVTDGPRLDMYSRGPHDGFVQHGNETAKFTDAAQ